MKLPWARRRPTPDPQAVHSDGLAEALREELLRLYVDAELAADLSIRWDADRGRYLADLGDLGDLDELGPHHVGVGPTRLDALLDLCLLLPLTVDLAVTLTRKEGPA